jgi:hypothetical protein
MEMHELGPSLGPRGFNRANNSPDVVILPGQAAASSPLPLGSEDSASRDLEMGLIEGRGTTPRSQPSLESGSLERYGFPTPGLAHTWSWLRHSLTAFLPFLDGSPLDVGQPLAVSPVKLGLDEKKADLAEQRIKQGADKALFVVFDQGRNLFQGFDIPLSSERMDEVNIYREIRSKHCQVRGYLRTWLFRNSLEIRPIFVCAAFLSFEKC